MPISAGYKRDYSAGDGGAGCQLVEAVEIDFSISCRNEIGSSVHSICSRIRRVLIFRRLDEVSSSPLCTNQSGACHCQRLRNGPAEPASELTPSSK